MGHARETRLKTASQIKPQDDAAVVQEEWRRIPQAAARWLVRSTRRGCVARMRVTAGGPTRCWDFGETRVLDLTSLQIKLMSRDSSGTLLLLRKVQVSF